MEKGRIIALWVLWLWVWQGTVTEERRKKKQEPVFRYTKC